MATSFSGYFNSSSFLMKCFLLLFVTTCSTSVSLAISFINFLMNRGSHNSDAMPRSLQQRMRAFDLHPSVAVGIPSGSKYCCSPRAIDTSLSFHSSVTVPFTRYEREVGRRRERQERQERIPLTVPHKPIHTPSSPTSPSQLSPLSAPVPSPQVQTRDSISCDT